MSGYLLMANRGSVVLICPDFFDYQRLISTELSRRFDDVVSFSDRPPCSSIVKAIIKYNIFYLRSYFSEKYSKSLLQVLSSNLSDISDVLIIKGTSITPDFIDSIRKVNPAVRVICYTWDSIANIGTFPSLAAKSDLSFTFDVEDSIFWGFRYLPLFYANQTSLVALVAELPSSLKCFKHSFVGSYHGDRAYVLSTFLSTDPSESNYVKLFFQSKLQYVFYYLKDPALRAIPREWITFNPVSRIELENISQQSEYVIDIHHPAQTGLTMRTWETLSKGYRLITTNPSILLHCVDDSVGVIDRKTGKRWTQEQCQAYKDDLSERVPAVFNREGISISTWIDALLEEDCK